MKSFSQRLLITVLSLWTGLAALHAANVVTVTGGDGAPDGEATITVALKTDAADVAAAEIRIPLPEGIEPVEGSVSLDSGRAPGHSVTADMNGSDYVIVIFNTSLATIPAGNGRLLTFKVKLGDNPGRFDLTPRVKLSGKGGDALASEASGGSLNILAPRLELGTTAIDFGRVPIRSEAVQYVSVRNSGTATLTFGGYDTGVEGLTAVMPEQLGEGEWGTIELHYCPTVRSAGIDGRLTPESDGVGRRQFIRIQSVPFSVNELHIGNASGISDEEVTVSVSMNNMEPITGADFSIALPDELEFVDGSVSKGARASALSVESTVGADRRLRIVLFGLSNKAVEGNDGELLSFRLKLKGRSGYYTLTPEKTRLANAAGEDMTSEVYSGSVTIDSPQLSSDSDWQIGNVALSGTHSFGYSVYNGSSVPLTIEKVVFPDDIAECETAMPLVVAPYGQSEITVAIKEPEFGKFATTMNLYSNDPDNRMKSVSVTGNFYSPNEMSFAGRSAGGKFLIDASLSNEEPIAALQLDIVCPDGISTDESLLELAGRASGHSATLAKVDRYRYRLVIFSLKNTPFTGNDGLLFSLGMEGASVAGKQVRFENIKLSSTDGVNITTPDSDVKLGELPIPVSSITLSEQALSLRVGQSTILRATVMPYDATDKTVTWTSSNEAVATVDAEGKVTAMALGEAVITATCGDVSATCAVSVVATPAENIYLNQTTASLKVNQTVALTATVMPEDATDKTVTWTSSNEAVATVDAEGMVTAKALGQAVITAKCGEVSATCAVTVVPTPAESVTLSLTTASLKVNQTVALTATVMPEDATDKTVTWTSSDEAVATVDAEGKVTAMALGEAVITATCGDVSATCAVTVVATPVESVTLNQTTASLRAGQTVTLTATVMPEDATDKTVTWTSSNESVATVDAEGMVTAKALGEAVIIASCGDASATCAVTVVATPVESVTLNQTTASLKVGQTVALTVTVMPEDATDKTVTWTSSNESVATVDAEGKVTAKALGQAVITAKCGEVSATCAVTVVATPVESVTLNQTTASLKVGQTVALTVTVMPEDATDKTVTWTSSNEAVATVDAEGKVTAMALGEAVITATCGDVSATCAVSVVATPAENIYLNQTTASLKVGETVALTATVMPEDATDKTVTWTSSNEAVATVDAEGKVTAKALGQAVITAKCGEVSATCAVTVVPTPAESVTLSLTTASLRAGQTVTLTATVMPYDATDKTVTWTSSNEAVATVDAEGKVTAMALGEAVITATCGDVSATCAVTVVATPVESVTLDYESIELRLGETFVLTATVMPYDATDKTVTWTSSDTGVITVDENGQITAIGMKDSEATVTATAANGASASCHVTVLAPLATSIELDQTMISATVGDEVQLTATILPAEASDQTIEWRSSDEAVATVSASGLVSVVAVGDVTITASTTDGSNLSAACVIKAVSGVEFVYPDDTAKHDVYNLQGIIVKRDATIKDFKALRPGFYIVNGKKIYKR